MQTTETKPYIPLGTENNLLKAKIDQAEKVLMKILGRSTIPACDADTIDDLKRDLRHIENHAREALQLLRQEAERLEDIIQELEAENATLQEDRNQWRGAAAQWERNGKSDFDRAVAAEAEAETRRAERDYSVKARLMAEKDLEMALIEIERLREENARLGDSTRNLIKELEAWRERFPVCGFDGNQLVMSG